MAAHIVMKIPPGGRLDFTAGLKMLSATNEIRLGIYFTEVDRSFPTGVYNTKTNYHKRKKKDIIWADVHRFE